MFSTYVLLQLFEASLRLCAKSYLRSNWFEFDSLKRSNFHSTYSFAEWKANNAWYSKNIFIFKTKFCIMVSQRYQKNYILIQSARFGLFFQKSVYYTRFLLYKEEFLVL